MTIWHLLRDNPENAADYASSLIKTPKTDEDSENYWFPTPEEHGDPQTHTPIQQKFLRELRNLQELEKLNPQDDLESSKQFFANFDWADSTLNPTEIAQIEELLVEFHDNFARHRFVIGMNEEFKVKLIPKDDSPAYSQSLPTIINLKEDILVELALIHKYGITTTLPFSKYASPIFAQKKPNGKLQFLVDLRKINNLISDDYINNNHHPVSTLTPRNIWQENDYFANWIALKHITASRWLTRGQLKCWLSSLPAGPLPTADYRKAGVKLCRPSRALCVNIWIK